RTERGVGLAGPQAVGRRAEDLAQDVGIEDHDEARVERGAEPDDVAVAPPARVQEARGADQEAKGEQQARQPRSGGQRDLGGSHGPTILRAAWRAPPPACSVACPSSTSRGSWPRPPKRANARARASSTSGAATPTFRLRRGPSRRSGRRCSRPPLRRSTATRRSTAGGRCARPSPAATRSTTG